MTMLDRMRRHKGWLKWSLVIVCVAFVWFYVPDFFTPTTGVALNDAVAEVEGTPITTAEFRRAYYNQLQIYQANAGEGFDEQILRQLGIDQQILQQMIDEQAAVVEALRLDLDVTDAEVRQRIITLPALQENGVFIGEARYRQLLRFQQPPVAPAEFEDSVRRALLVDKLRAALTGWITVPESDVREEYRRRNEKVKLDVITFSAEDFKEGVSVTEEELAAHLEANAADYLIPEKRQIRYVTIEAADLRAEVVVPDVDVESYYTDNITQYETPEQVWASHILFSTDEADEATVREQAEAVLAQARDGADFADLAREHSDDAGSAALGGDLDFFGRGRMVPEFEEVAFSLEPDAISDLVQSQFGFHIIKVHEKREPSTRPLEEVRDQIADQLQWDRAQARADALAQELTGQITTPDQLEQVATERGWEIEESEPFAQADPIAGLGIAPNVAATAFATEEGEVAGPVRASQGHVFLQVTGIEEPYDPELDEVRADVETDLIELRAGEAAEARAREMAELLAAAEDFVSAAEANDLAVTTTDLIARGTAIPGVGLDDAVERVAFELDVGQTSEALITDSNVAIVHIAEREEITEEGFAAAADQLRLEMRANRQGQFFAAYMAKAKETMAIETFPVKVAQALG